MKLPWVSRKNYEGLRLSREIMEAKLTAHYEAKVEHIHAELAHVVDCYNAMRELEQQERWRRLRAEGLCQFKDDRIRRVLGLPGFQEPAEEKKTA